MWLSMFMRVSKSYCVSCADDADASAKNAPAPRQSDHFCNLVRMSIPLKPCLEIKVKADQQFAGVDVGKRSGSWIRRSGAILMQPVVLVVPGKTSAAGHERVVAVTNGVRRDIAEVGRGRTHDSVSSDSCVRRSVGLLRHPDRLVPANEDQLRAVDVVRLQQYTVPRGRLRANGKSGAGRIIQRRVTVGYIAIPLSKPCVILAVLSHDREVDMGAEVELTNEALAAEGLVADRGGARTISATEDGSALGEPRSGRLADHGIEANALNS